MHCFRIKHTGNFHCITCSRLVSHTALVSASTGIEVLDPISKKKSFRYRYNSTAAEAGRRNAAHARDKSSASRGSASLPFPPSLSSNPRCCRQDCCSVAVATVGRAVAGGRGATDERAWSPLRPLGVGAAQLGLWVMFTPECTCTCGCTGSIQPPLFADHEYVHRSASSQDSKMVFLAM